MTSFELQDKEGIIFYDSTRITGVDQNQTDADQYDDIFRDPDYMQKEKSEIELVVDDQISEQEIDNLKKIKRIKMGMKKNPLMMKKKSIHQISDKEDQEEHL